MKFSVAVSKKRILAKVEAILIFSPLGFIYCRYVVVVSRPLSRLLFRYFLLEMMLLTVPFLMQIACCS